MILFLDVNECQSAPCGLNAKCTNTEGSYDCKCQSGFQGNGANCTGKARTNINHPFFYNGEGQYLVRMFEYF